MFDSKKGVLTYTLIVTTTDGESRKFRVVRSVIGNKQHEIDFQKLLERYSGN